MGKIKKQEYPEISELSYQDFVNPAIYSTGREIEDLAEMYKHFTWWLIAWQDRTDLHWEDKHPVSGISVEKKLEKEIEKIKPLLNTLGTVSISKKKTLPEERELIWWKGSAPQLLYLIELLYNANLIDITQYKHRYALIEENFVNEYKERFDNGVLARTFDRMIKVNKDSKPNRQDAEPVESVLKELRNFTKQQKEDTSK